MRSQQTRPAQMLAMFITRLAVWIWLHPNDFAVDLRVEDFAFTPAERDLFWGLHARGVRFIVVGMSAAVLEGAPVATQDIDVWFEHVDDERIREAAKAAGGFWISGFGMQPPSFGGPGLERIDVVLTVHGLEGFAAEYSRTFDATIEGVLLRVLPLNRVIASKRATNRLKDQASLPALEATLLAKQTSQCPRVLLHVTEKRFWEAIRNEGLVPESRRTSGKSTGQDKNHVSAFGGVANPTDAELMNFREAVASSKYLDPVEGSHLSADDMIVIQIDVDSVDAQSWRAFPGEKVELERELPREIWTKLTYWKTEQVVAPSRLKRLPEEEDG